MEKPKFSKLGDPFSKMGQIYVAEDIEGGIQISVDVMKTTLEANKIAITPQIERELTEYFTTQQDAYDKKVLSEGVPEKLTTLLGFTRKRDLVNYCKRITISEDELYLLIHNTSLIGYKCDSKFPEYLPENRRLSKADRLLINKDPGKLFSKINAIFEERKHYMVHLFHDAEKWHCFYYTYKEMEPTGKNQWKYGPHLHFINYLWPNFRKKQVWLAFDKREHNVDGIHIKLEPMLQSHSNSSKEFEALALSFIKRYKSVTNP